MAMIHSPRAANASHKISRHLIDDLIKGPSPTKVTQVANMQNYIQSLLGETHHTFLQGSYKNDTSISDINDVDIVAIRLNTYSGVFSPGQRCHHVTWDQIFTEIEHRLKNQSKYSWTVARDDKCVFVRGAFSADVVPAVLVGDDRDIDPMVIYSFKSGQEKLNRPRVHYANGVGKNSATKGRYKPMVRMFKNWNENHFSGSKAASSFKVESLVHACDDALFVYDEAEAFIRLATAILEKVNAPTLSRIILPSVCGYEDIAANWETFERAMFSVRLKQSIDDALNAYRATSQSQADEFWKRGFNI